MIPIPSKRLLLSYKDMQPGKIMCQYLELIRRNKFKQAEMVKTMPHIGIWICLSISICERSLPILLPITTE